ncbi:MAG TPA: ATP-binding protein [Actinomycetes bacterium]|nr:ATP-binding protein [Actinomycetes bacterium]
MSRPVASPSEWTDSAAATSNVSVPLQAARPEELSRSVWLEAHLTAPHDARELVRALATEWGLANPTLDDAVSVASELVTNAVVHAHSRFQLSVSMGSEHLTIRVASTFRRSDDSSTETPRADSTDHGVGLWIVDHLAESWGTLNTRQGKAVWASLALTATNRT